MTEDTTEQIGRLEATIDRLATYLHESRVPAPTPKRSMWESATPIIAIVAMGISAVQSWSVTGQRLDILEKQQQAQAAKVDSWEVPQLKWQMSQVDQRLGRLETSGSENSTKLAEIRETLIKLGLQITAKK